MRLRFPSLGFILVMLGVLFIYGRIPVLDVVGVVLFFAGLALPIFKESSSMDVGQREDRDSIAPQRYPPAPRDPPPSQSGASEREATLFDACLMLGAYLERVYSGDDLAIPWLIELSNNPYPQIRRMCCTKGFRYLPKYDNDVLIRLREMEEFDPKPDIREDARKARERMESIRAEWEIGAD